MKETFATSQPTEIRKGGVGVNIPPQGATAPQGPLSNFTHRPTTTAPAPTRPAQGKK